MSENPKLGTPDESSIFDKKLSPQRKIEIFGVGLLLLGFLMFLSILSNKEADYSLISSMGWKDLFSFGGTFSSSIQNWMGMIGAILSHHLIYNLFGYPVIFLTLLVMVWGWILLRHHGLTKPVYFTIYGLIFTLFLSSFFGFVSIVSEGSFFSNAYSGLIGVFLGSVVYGILGAIGGTLFLLTGIFLTIVLFIDLDLKETAKRLQYYLIQFFDFLQQKFTSISFGKLIHWIQNWKTNKADINSVDSIPTQTQPHTEIVTQLDPEENFVEPPTTPSVANQATILKSSPTEPPEIVYHEQRPIANRHIGIPLAEILPEKPDEVLEQPIEIVVSPDEFTGGDEDFIPKIESVNSTETSFPLMLDDSIDSDTDSSLQRSGSLSGYLKTKIPGEILPPIVPVSNNPIPAVDLENKSDSVEPPRLTIKFSETESSSPEVVQASTISPTEKSATFQKEHSEENIVSENVQQNSQTNTNDEHIELVVKPIIEEAKSKGPRDPIFKFGYKKPPIDLLDYTKEDEKIKISTEELEENALKLVQKLKSYNIEIQGKPVVTVGPAVTLYEIIPAEGIKVSRITSLQDDIALAMAAKGIRIMAPIPGKSAVGVEIPNKTQAIVRLREVIESEKFQQAEANGFLLPIVLGRLINNSIYVEDLAKLPHLLIAGTTGSGKSVGVNNIIMSLLYFAHPSHVKFVMIDPKKIELSIYRRLEKTFLATLPELNEPILTDTSKAVTLLRSVEKEMDDRYTLLARVGVRHLKEFNKKVETGQLVQTENGDPYVKLPFIVVVIDELADLMMTSGKDVEEPIARLAQLARAVGIHLVVATQRPSVDVITGIIKANFPARIAYQVMSKIDSRTILDMNGADQLIGRGDMLYLPPSEPKPVRIQNAFVSTEECDKVIDYIAKQPGYLSSYRLPTPPNKDGKGNLASRDSGNGMEDWDDLLEEAAYIVVQTQQGSTSMLQRRLKIGYSRAARMIDQMEILGIVGPPDGSKGRNVLVDDPSLLKDILDIK